MDWLSKCIELSKDVAEVIALVAAAVWFFKQREKWPKACLGHYIRSWPITHDRQLIRISLDIRNVGKVLLKIRDGFTEIYQLKPWPEELVKTPIGQIQFSIKGATEFQWSKLNYRYLDGKSMHAQQSSDKDWPKFSGHDIEPKENEEIFFDFIIPANVELVSVYSRIENANLRKREFGWNLTTLFDIRTQEIIAKTEGVNLSHTEHKNHKP